MSCSEPFRTNLGEPPAKLPWWTQVLIDVDGGVSDMFLEPEVFEALLGNVDILVTLAV